MLPIPGFAHVRHASTVRRNDIPPSSAWYLAWWHLERVRVSYEPCGEIQHVLNRGESMRTLQRAIHDGQIRNELAKRNESLAEVSSALSLMCNIVMAWNAGHMQVALDRIREADAEPSTEDLRRIAPTNIEGINPRGTYDFPVEKYAERILPSSVASTGSPRWRSA